MKLPNSLAKLFDNSPVSFDPNLSGQALDNNNNFVLGGRAGPEISVCNLVHEMAHLAELDIQRLLQKPSYGWGFKHGRFWQIGRHTGFESTTDQSVRREMRVWAYQLSVEKEFGIKNEGAKRLVSSVVFMEAFTLYKWKVVSENTMKQLGHEKAEKHCIELMAKDVINMSNSEFTFDKFIAEWTKRMDVLGG